MMKPAASNELKKRSAGLASMLLTAAKAETGQGEDRVPVEPPGNSPVKESHECCGDTDKPLLILISLQNVRVSIN